MFNKRTIHKKRTKKVRGERVHCDTVIKTGASTLLLYLSGASTRGVARLERSGNLSSSMSRVPAMWLSEMPQLFGVAYCGLSLSTDLSEISIRFYIAEAIEKNSPRPWTFT